jgi:hypothetical protein
MPFSLRLDPETEAKIRRLARASGRSKSSIVREAMAQYDAGEVPTRAGDASVLDRLGPFIGVVGTGGADLSVDTHTKYRARLRGRRVRRSD